jgi:hypothetical protein
MTLIRWLTIRPEFAGAAPAAQWSKNAGSKPIRCLAPLSPAGIKICNDKSIDLGFVQAEYSVRAWDCALKSVAMQTDWKRHSREPLGLPNGQ